MLPPPSSNDDDTDGECDCHDCDECLEADVFLAVINKHGECFIKIVVKMLRRGWNEDRIIKAIRGD